MLGRIGIISLAAAGLLALASVFFASSAGAIHDVVIEYDRIDAPPGTVVEIASEEVEPEFQGTVCRVHVEVANNSSEHPGTDLIFTSGSQTLVVEDVELEAGAVFVGDGEILVEGTTLTVSVRIGPHGITSGGLSITFDCDVQPPTTTEPPPTTGPPGTEPPAPTSTERPPPTSSSVAPQTTVPTTLPPSSPEPPTAADPTFTG